MVEQELSNTIRKKVLPLQCDRNETNCLTKKTSAAIALTSRINLAGAKADGGGWRRGSLLRLQRDDG